MKTNSILARVRPTQRLRPPRIVVYGPQGVGKSSFAAAAPNPIFIQLEDGLDGLKAFSPGVLSSVAEVEGMITELLNDPHDFQTVVVDTVDWLEPLIWREVAKAANVPHIEDIGYGKGFLKAGEKLKHILAGLDALRDRRNMIVIVLAHAKIERFDDPSSGSYDRQQLDLHKNAASILVEWPDIVGFINYRSQVKATDIGFNKEARRGVGSGERSLFTQPRPAFVAKCRFGMPDEMPLRKDDPWNPFFRAFLAAQSNAPVEGAAPAPVLAQEEPALAEPAAQPEPQQVAAAEPEATSEAPNGSPADAAEKRPPWEGKRRSPAKPQGAAASAPAAA